MQQGHYFIAPIDLRESGKLRLSLSKALVSRNGIYRIFPESEEAHRAFLDARVFQAEIEGRALSGRLVREQGPAGTHYNLRLLELEGEEAEHMEDLLAAKGFASPWKREFARLPVSTVSERAEYPALAIFPRLVGKTAGEVVNFSSRGLLFEFLATGISMSEHVGQKAKLHLVTSKGRRIHDVEAKIARIYDEMLAPGKMIRGLGMKFVHLPPEGGAVYRDLLLNVLEEIRRSS